MKKLTFATIALILLVSASQVSAVNENANEKATNNPSSEKRNENSQKEVPPTQAPVNEAESSDNGDTSWKNHGEYVSSVAKTHPGGEVVSEAARSDTGKRDAILTATPSPTIDPSIDPSITPTDDPTPTPTDDPNATPSPTLTDTPTPTPDENIGETSTVEGVISAIEDLIATLKGLLNL